MLLNILHKDSSRPFLDTRPFVLDLDQHLAVHTLYEFYLGYPLSSLPTALFMVIPALHPFPSESLLRAGRTI
jgi:hypothetical protein